MSVPRSHETGAMIGDDIESLHARKVEVVYKADTATIIDDHCSLN
jgi:hypothetical protein